MTGPNRYSTSRAAFTPGLHKPRLRPSKMYYTFTPLDLGGLRADIIGDTEGAETVNPTIDVQPEIQGNLPAGWSLNTAQVALTNGTDHYGPFNITDNLDETFSIAVTRDLPPGNYTVAGTPVDNPSSVAVAIANYMQIINGKCYEDGTPKYTEEGLIKCLEEVGVTTTTQILEHALADDGPSYRTNRLDGLYTYYSHQIYGTDRPPRSAWCYYFHKSPYISLTGANGELYRDNDFTVEIKLGDVQGTGENSYLFESNGGYRAFFNSTAGTLSVGTGSGWKKFTLDPKNCTLRFWYDKSQTDLDRWRLFKDDVEQTGVDEFSFGAPSGSGSSMYLGTRQSGLNQVELEMTSFKAWSGLVTNTSTTTNLVTKLNCNSETGTKIPNAVGSNPDGTLVNGTEAIFHRRIAEQDTNPINTFTFPGDDDHIDLPASVRSAIDNDHTIEITIVRVQPTGGDQYVFEGNSGPLISINSTGTQIVYGTTSGWRVFTFLGAGVYRFVHDTSESGFARFKMYYNNVEQTEASAPVGSYLAPATSANMHLGARFNGNTGFKGTISRAAIWSGVSAGGDTATNRVFLTNCTDRSGTTITNESGDDATLVNSDPNFFTTAISRNENPANSEGYGLDGTIVLPRDVENLHLDSDGNALTHVGQCPYPIVASTPTFYMDDAAGYIDCGNDSSIKVSGAFSVEAVFNCRDLSTTPGLIAHGYSYTSTAVNAAWGVSFDAADGQVRVTLSDGTTSNTHGLTATINEDTWYHIVVTWDGTTNTSGIKVYLNGTLAGTATANVTSINQTPAFENHLKWCNRYYSAGSYAFVGELAHGALWKSELSADNVSYLYDQSTGTKPIDPNGLWTFQEGPGSGNTNRTVYDYSGNGNNGTVVGGTVANQWSRTCPGYTKDHCITLGGSVISGVFIGTVLHSTLDAAGNTSTYEAGSPFNPLTRENFNYWNAAEYIGRNIPTDRDPSTEINPVITPANSAFSRLEATKRDRYLVMADTLTGTDLTNVQTYVEDI